MRKTLLLSIFTCGLLLSATNIQAKSDTKTLVQKQVQNSKKEFKQAPKEVLDALDESSLAMKSLQNHKIDEAKKYLKKATDNFNKALKENPSLDIIPLDQRMEVYENLDTTKEIIQILAVVKDYLNHYKLDSARSALAPLKDEIDIQTISIPMKLFPLATQSALEALNKGNEQEAIATLAEGYSTFITVKTVIPLPLLTAQDLIVEASILGKDKKDEATKLLEAAKDELKRAEVLGYTDTKAEEYKALNDDIDVIKKEIKGKNEIVKLYDKLKDKFSSLLHKSKTTTLSNKAESEVNTYENKENIKAIKDSDLFHTEAKTDEAKELKQ